MACCPCCGTRFDARKTRTQSRPPEEHRCDGPGCDEIFERPMGGRKRFCGRSCQLREYQFTRSAKNSERLA